MTSDAISLGMMRPVQILVVHEIILTYLHTKLNKLKKNCAHFVLYAAEFSESVVMLCWLCQAINIINVSFFYM